jgi:excinuclease ABC subunit B
MAGRAARNVNGLVIFYADRMTDSMQRTIDECDRRRTKQIAYNTKHGITPKTVRKGVEQIMKQTSVLDIKGYDEKSKYAVPDEAITLAAEDVVEYKGIAQLEKLIASTKKAMEKAAKDLDFMEAARLRDKMLALQKEKEAMK